MLRSLTYISLSTISIALCVVICFSCNKNSNPQSTTIIKCVTCANGGLCINDTCRCPSGFEGVSCQTTSRDKFIGEWSVIEKGTLTPEREYQVQIGSNFASLNAVQLSGFYQLSGFPELTAYVSSDTVYIPSQQQGGKIIVGTGYIHSSSTFGQNGAITMWYMVTDTATHQIDDFGYNSPSTSPSQWTR